MSNNKKAVFLHFDWNLGTDIWENTIIILALPAPLLQITGGLQSNYS